MDYSSPPVQATADRLNHTVSNAMSDVRIVSEWVRVPGYAADSCLSTAVDIAGHPALFNGDSVYARTDPASYHAGPWSEEQCAEVEREHTHHLSQLISGVAHV